MYVLRKAPARRGYIAVHVIALFAKFAALFEAMLMDPATRWHQDLMRRNYVTDLGNT